jgi:hypothetical protein
MIWIITCYLTMVNCVMLTFIHVSACTQSIMTLCLSCSPSCDALYITLVCIHVLHCCISSRYARYTMCGHGAHDVGAKPKDGVLVG